MPGDPPDDPLLNFVRALARADARRDRNDMIARDFSGKKPRLEKYRPRRTEKKQMKRLRHEVLPYSLPPIGISREQASAFVGVSTSLFDRCVDAGTMPQPRQLGQRLIWDVEELIAAFRKLPHHNDGLDETPSAIRSPGNAFDNAKKAGIEIT